MSSNAATLPRPPQASRTSFRVLGAISTAHMINDTVSYTHLTLPTTERV